MRLDGLPAALAERPQWLTWKYEPRSNEDQPTKVPYSSVRSGKGSSTDSASWSDLRTAAEYAAAADMSGVALVVTADDPLCGVDLDDCRDPETGALEPWASAIVELLDSYTEVSPSQCGLRVWVEARKPGSRCSRAWGTGKVEIYDRERFFTVTGDRLEGTPASILERQAELDQLYLELFPTLDSRPANLAETSTNNLDDDALFERAMTAANGDKFRRLWEGDHAGHSSASEADLALCAVLSFWVGPDAPRIDSWFRRSGLMRRKWDERRGATTYGKRTITKALAGASEFYSPSSPTSPAAMGANGSLSSSSSLSYSSRAWPKVNDEAFHGLAGDFVRTVEPHSEADPLALLVQFLTAFGAYVGRTPHFRVEADKHRGNLFAVIVGDTSRARKGTSWGYVRRLFKLCESRFDALTESGLSSGEGLIWRVRDPVTNGQGEVTDEGIKDKRLIVAEAEFAAALKVMSRQGNTLSAVIGLSPEIRTVVFRLLAPAGW